MRKIPFIPQLNSTECGVCVLTMILRYFGAHYSMKEIRNYLPTSRDGVTIRRLINAFEYYGINAVAYHGNIDNASNFSLPAIITWENSHYVIIERIGSNKVYIIDPNFGRIKMDYEEFNKSYSGIIIILSKTERFKKKSSHFQLKNSFSSILFYYRKNLFLVVSLCLLSQLFTVSVPISIQYIIDGLIYNRFHFYYIALFFFFICLNSSFAYLKKHYITVLGIDIDSDVNKKLVAKLLTVKYNFYDIKSNTEIIYALNNIACVKNIYLEYILGSIFDILTILFILAYLFHLNVIFFIIVFITSVPNIIFYLFMDQPIQRDIRMMIREYEKMNGQQIEIIYSILGIKTSSVEKPIFDKWNQSYNTYYKKNKDYLIKLNIFMVTLSTIINLLPIIVLIIAILFMQRDMITIGETMTFYTLTNILFGSVNTILRNVRSLRDELLTLNRIEDIMQYDEVISLSCADNKINIDGDIEIMNISFRYSEDGDYILKNISCTIKQNSKVAIIGDSGSGKSTFLKVLSGLYKLDCGVILYNNNRMDCNLQTSIKKQIGFVAQNVWPTNQSIKEYILLGLNNVTMEDVENACKIVNIHDEIMRMPMKYHTIISETGKNISGGQCQRIMLARMILLKPKILLLDEVTSALDITNENNILNYFFKQNCMIIMVTHKIESLKMCDQILVMKNGTILTKGNYDELIREYGNILIS